MFDGVIGFTNLHMYKLNLLYDRDLAKYVLILTGSSGAVMY